MGFARSLRPVHLHAQLVLLLMALMCCGSIATVLILTSYSHAGGFASSLLRLGITSAGAAQRVFTAPEGDDSLDLLLSRPPRAKDKLAFRMHNNYKLRLLTACKVRGDCQPNADKVRGFGTFDWREAR